MCDPNFRPGRSQWFGFLQSPEMIAGIAMKRASQRFEGPEARPKWNLEKYHES